MTQPELNIPPPPRQRRRAWRQPQPNVLHGINCGCPLCAPPTRRRVWRPLWQWLQANPIGGPIGCLAVFGAIALLAAFHLIPGLDVLFGGHR